MIQKPAHPNYKGLAQNRRAQISRTTRLLHWRRDRMRHCPAWSEVKSLRLHPSNIAESYAAVEAGALWRVERLDRAL